MAIIGGILKLPKVRWISRESASTAFQKTSASVRRPRSASPPPRSRPAYRPPVSLPVVGSRNWAASARAVPSMSSRGGVARRASPNPRPVRGPRRRARPRATARPSAASAASDSAHSSRSAMTRSSSALRTRPNCGGARASRRTCAGPARGRGRRRVQRVLRAGRRRARERDLRAEPREVGQRRARRPLHGGCFSGARGRALVFCRFHFGHQRDIKSAAAGGAVYAASDLEDKAGQRRGALAPVARRRSCGRRAEPVGPRRRDRASSRVPAHPPGGRPGAARTGPARARASRAACRA